MGTGCCSGKEPNPAEGAIAEMDDCCAGGPASEPDTCCDSEGDDEDDKKIECCDSNEELCNDKCIIAAAAYECQDACGNGNEDTDGHDHAHDEEGNHPSTACNTHIRAAFEQYAAYLETARCICRSVLERGFATACCASQTTPAPAEAVLGGIAPSAVGVGGAGQSTAHAHGSRKLGGHHGGLKRRGKKHSHKSHHGHHDEHGHHEQHDHGHEHSSHGGTHIAKPDPDQASCCSDHHGHDIIAPISDGSMPFTTDHTFSDKGKVRDEEKDSGFEHVALMVDGMTCSGCGNKLETTLKASPGVTNVSVNFVMGRAEFSLDPSAGKADDIVHVAERATGFRIVRRGGGDQMIDILVPRQSAKRLAELEVPGLRNVFPIDKKTVRVTYDPAVTGARTLLDGIGDLSEGLAPPRADPSVSSGRKRLYDQLIKTVVAAVLTIPVVVLAWGDTLVDEKTRAIVSIVLATFVQLLAVPDFYHPAISALIHSGVLEMDMLVVISITAAYLYSLVAFGFRMADRPLETSEFFETSTLLITLVLAGRLIAAFARIRAVAAVSLRSLQTPSAVIIEDGKDREIDCRLLQFGDKFKVLPHSRVPTDGLILGGSSEVDESMLTGESIPVVKQTGMTIIAGTLNGSGTLTAQLTRLPGKNTVTDIAELVEEASKSKPQIQDLADRVASYFVPVVSGIAVIVTVIWIAVGLRVRNESSGKAVADAITYAVAVLAVSCPCALGLAVPMVLVIAGGIAARGGVIIKSAECAERSRRVTDVVFDKTGTLTEEDLDVVMENIFAENSGDAVAITKALVEGNKHPVSTAIAKHFGSDRSEKAAITDIHVIPGAGVQATYQGKVLKAGNPSWTKTESVPAVATAMNEGMTILCVTANDIPIALFGLKSRLRVDAATVIAQLRSRHIAVHLVSGDQPSAVDAVAASVGIDASNTASRRSPAEKRTYVASLMAEGKVVLFCGDGTNDAVAVAQADIGVQLGGSLSSSDVTRGAADVVLLAGLGGIPFLLDVSRAAFHRMVFNFVWSGVYNVLAILLAAGAFVNVRIPPAYAGLGEIVSVLPVIFAAMTMLLLKLRA